MGNNINIKDLSSDELDILIDLQKEKINKIKSDLKDELTHFNELLQKIDK